LWKRGAYEVECKEQVTMNMEIDKLEQEQKELQEDVSALKDTIFDPDNGVYSRIKALEAAVIKDGHLRMATVEQTVNTIKKIQWMVIGSVVATLTGILVKFLVM
jgi:hypothetical protein